MDEVLLSTQGVLVPKARIVADYLSEKGLGPEHMEGPPVWRDDKDGLFIGIKETVIAKIIIPPGT